MTARAKRKADRPHRKQCQPAKRKRDSAQHYHRRSIRISGCLTFCEGNPSDVLAQVHVVVKYAFPRQISVTFLTKSPGSDRCQHKRIDEDSAFRSCYFFEVSSKIIGSSPKAFCRWPIRSVCGRLAIVIMTI